MNEQTEFEYEIQNLKDILQNLRDVVADLKNDLRYESGRIDDLARDVAQAERDISSLERR